MTTTPINATDRPQLSSAGEREFRGNLIAKFVEPVLGRTWPSDVESRTITFPTEYENPERDGETIEVTIGCVEIIARDLRNQYRWGQQTSVNVGADGVITIEVFQP